MTAVPLRAFLLLAAVAACPLASSSRPEAAYRCRGDDDCVLSGRLGAVNRSWLEASKPAGWVDSSEGCRAQLAHRALCLEGTCATVLVNGDTRERVPACTRQPIRW
jgi:hypothetical protein